MNLTAEQVDVRLQAAGINTKGWFLFDRSFEPVSVAKVQEVADACLDALPDDMVTYRWDGTRNVRVPLWIAEAGDCETHSFVLFAWLIIGNWHRAIKDGVKRGGLAAGPLIYTAAPRAANGGRKGRHAILWHMDHDQNICFFEFGDNRPTTLTREEIASITNGFAA